MLTPEQTKVIKEQLIQQIEKSFPPERKEFAKNQIQAMDSEQLEEFLKKNQLIRSEASGTPTSQSQTECVFCSIAKGDIQSYKIDENKNAIAVLEINPLTKGHTIVIPKEHISSSEKFPQNIFALAKNISKKLKSKLKPKNVKINSSNMFGHEIINVIPIYEDEEKELNSERRKESPEELIELQKSLSTKKTVKKPKTKKLKAKGKEKLWLPKRIP